MLKGCLLGGIDLATRERNDEIAGLKGGMRQQRR